MLMRNGLPTGNRLPVRRMAATNRDPAAVGRGCNGNRLIVRHCINPAVDGGSVEYRRRHASDDSASRPTAKLVARAAPVPEAGAGSGAHNSIRCVCSDRRQPGDSGRFPAAPRRQGERCGGNCSRSPGPPGSRSDLNRSQLTAPVDSVRRPAPEPAGFGVVQRSLEDALQAGSQRPAGPCSSCCPKGSSVRLSGAVANISVSSYRRCSSADRVNYSPMTETRCVRGRSAAEVRSAPFFDCPGRRLFGIARLRLTFPTP